MLDNLIRNVHFYGLILLTSLFLLSACSREPEFQPTPVVETRTVEVRRPAPIVPDIDQLRLRSVDWKIVTPENIDSVFDSLTGDEVLFALTADGYEALSLNLSDVRSMIQQQQRIIAIYKSSFR